MNDCPPAEILLYEDRIPGRLAEHVAQCEACSAIVALRVFRGLPDRPETRGGCDDAVLAIAALLDGALDELGHRRLAVHLVGCSLCRETALRLSFSKDEIDGLPEIVVPPAPAANDACTQETGVTERKGPRGAGSE